jgi:hypothetical protein
VRREWASHLVASKLSVVYYNIMSFLNSRIRRLPTPIDHGHQYFSVSSRNLPPGTLLVHHLRAGIVEEIDSKGDKNLTTSYFCSPCTLYNLHQVLLLKNDPIIDHGWTLVPSSQNGTNNHLHPMSVHNLYLAALTRSHDNRPQSFYLQSYVDIYCTNTILLQDTNSMTDESNPHISPMITFTVPSLATSLCIHGHFLAVSTSSGVHVYKIPHFTTDTMNGDSNNMDRRILVPYHTIHACNISFPWIAVASSDRIGVWNLDTLFTGNDLLPMSPNPIIPPSVWSTTLSSFDMNNRCTSISFSGKDSEYLAMSFMNGSVFLFQRSLGFECAAPIWDRIWHACVENVSDNILYPTFVGFIRWDRSYGTGLVYSKPGSILIRVLDHELLEETSSLGLDAMVGSSVLGLFTDNNKVIWIDEHMNVHEEVVV